MKSRHVRYLCAVLGIYGGMAFRSAQAATKPDNGDRDKPAILRTGEVPIGSLGKALGTYIKLEGKRAPGPKTGVRTFNVEKINGAKLDSPISIWVDNLDLPSDKPCSLAGYESARMIGKAPAYFEAMKELGKDAAAPQAKWQVQCFFVAVRVIEPVGLRISE